MLSYENLNIYKDDIEERLYVKGTVQKDNQSISEPRLQSEQSDISPVIFLTLIVETFVLCSL